jgi:beta-glucosidase
MRKVLSCAADVCRYFVWSLLYNFEWQAGSAQGFGVVNVDYVARRRIPETSADWHARLFRSKRNTVP